MPLYLQKMPVKAHVELMHTPQCKNRNKICGYRSEKNAAALNRS
jgi:hypothetical protein